MAKLLLLNGPNLNLLGSREPGVYGRTDLAEIESTLVTQAERLGHEMVCFQSNAEHELLDRVQRAADDGIAFILLNPAALTHTSIALRDALLAVAVPFIEIHLSNTYAREEFRQINYFSDIAAGCLIGLGAQGYELALQAAHKRLMDAEGD
ncbi:type II 3-dehydroquinate dehydratase [Woeseia oceani]|uniref:3-dehydroquinate dehydratase n=1 Tax=Woeseia oceani TaxID=1548547 RepID=A0A193LIG0_9GAMM|nr:type II 3-dehydroquinate dehydratase [Woeseia oceani]ANO52287.1 type II 3-dehydroquinate dehydratase [Woeseia oceani]